MKLEKTLQNFGLSEKETKVYLACLELGSASAYKISQKSSIARSTTYELLESLKKKGLVSLFKKKTVKYYSAEDPKKAIDLSKERVLLLENALPQLDALYGGSHEQPSVRFYQGKQGMKTIAEEILKEADTVFAFGSADGLLKTLSEYWPDFVERRVKSRIPAHIIVWKSKTAHERKDSEVESLRKVKIIPAIYKCNGVVFIWKKKIAMFSFQKDPIALVIESAELANVQQSMFNFMWDSDS